jgi:hypothetical protein
MISTRQYCVFFNGLTDDLQKSVKNICENAPDKSKIYSNIENDLIFWYQIAIYTVLY